MLIIKHTFSDFTCINSQSPVNNPRVWVLLLCLYFRSGKVTELDLGLAALVYQNQNPNPSSPACPNCYTPILTPCTLSLWNKKRMMREMGWKWRHQENSWSTTSAPFPMNLGHCLPSLQQRHPRTSLGKWQLILCGQPSRDFTLGRKPSWGWPASLSQKHPH